MTAYRYAYIHGFASSSESRKGLALAARFRDELGLELQRPDWNRPSFAALSFEGAIAALDELDADGGAPWRFVGSSMGGYLSALWARRNPERVDRLALLCPGFAPAERWPEIFGEDALRRWEEQGYLEIPDARGAPTKVHFGLVKELGEIEARPAVPCSTIIIHGRQDEVVPIATSRAYAAANAKARLIEVDDDHSLMANLDLIYDRLKHHFDLG